MEPLLGATHGAVNGDRMANLSMATDESDMNRNSGERQERTE